MRTKVEPSSGIVVVFVAENKTINKGEIMKFYHKFRLDMGNKQS